ncbi:MAG: methylglyoxal synthase [Actinomycetota bacterium]
MPATIALIAHDSKKDDIVEFATQHQVCLSRYRLIATEATGHRIQAATGLTIKRMLPGSMGGDTQIAAEVCSGQVVAVFFLVDSLQAQPHEPEIQTLLRVCNIHNVALATNRASAEAIATQLAKVLVAHLIFNPVAGPGNADRDLALIQQLLEPHFNLHIHFTTPEVNPATLAQEAIAAQADLVIASGGDGTISTVAGALIGTSIPLGIIPRGTANAFAAALGIPQLFPLRLACQTILTGNTRTVDVARCNNLPMILLAGVGYEAEMVNRATRELKQQWGVMAYLMAGWKLLDEQTLFDLEIEVSGQVHHLQASAITVANAAPPTSIMAQGAGQVIFDDGLLDVTISTASNKVQAVTSMLKMFGSALFKVNPQQPNIFQGRVNAIKIDTTPPQKVVVDGEVIGTTPIKIECIPKGLTVFSPDASFQRTA